MIHARASTAYENSAVCTYSLTDTYAAGKLRMREVLEKQQTARPSLVWQLLYICSLLEYSTLQFRVVFRTKNLTSSTETVLFDDS